MHENYHGMVTDLVKAVKESAFLLSVTDKKVKKALKKMIDAVERHDAYIAAVERHQNDPEIPKEPVPDPDHPGIYLNTKPPEEEPNVPAVMVAGTVTVTGSIARRTSTSSPIAPTREHGSGIGKPRNRRSICYRDIRAGSEWPGSGRERRQKPLQRPDFTPVYTWMAAIWSTTSTGLAKPPIGQIRLASTSARQ
ncbi:hypothetical protein CC53_gp165 [Rhizobium phage vB_RleS_L338C]|uniref:hypothetical protein n=1 Tax=Rhizobium phage vB_RleS_L338C TaxID=1414737 RepID=UPI0003D94CEB|nr:hypothetical protein CC53_gp165 [Rhizobium phage vB_RleS_L338C]AHC30582.1 hypothetical protein L338C_165 [Rhizobium phage vB_RleS_L338C]